jgi:hypothetical protein
MAREKDWLVQILKEASQRVDAWPEWKKAPDPEQGTVSSSNDTPSTHNPKEHFKCQ